MINKFIPLAFFILITSCKKDPVITPTVKTYDIYVNKWNPDTTISNSVLTPLFRLDLDGDQNLDFTYEQHTWSQWHDSSGYDVYSIRNLQGISFTDTNFSQAYYSDSNALSVFHNGDLIPLNADWKTSSYSYAIKYWLHPSFRTIEYFTYPFENSGGLGYVAVRKQVGSDYFYGWINLKVEKDQVTFYETGFNRIANEPIRVGQKN